MASHSSPAVSIIIPVLNSRQYFKECLDSVINQTLENIEIIIIDDASTDGSLELAETYANHDPRITIIQHKKTTGSGPARNDGMAIASGEYIAFMDSDDLYPSNNTLEILYSKAQEQHANICGGSLYKISANGQILNRKIQNQYFTTEGWIEYSDYQYEGGFSRFLYKNSFLKKNKLRFANLLRFQDPIFLVNTMIAGRKFYAVPFYCYAYRKHKSTIWDNANSKDHLKAVGYLLSISNNLSFSKIHFNMTKNLLNSLHNRFPLFIKIINILTIIQSYKNINWRLITEYRRNTYVKKYKFFFYIFIQPKAH